MIWINILRIVGVLICGIKISLILEERKTDSKPTTMKEEIPSSKCYITISPPPSIEYSQQPDSTASVRDQIQAGFAQQTRTICDQTVQMDNALKLMQDALKRQAEDAVIKKLENEIAYLKAREQACCFGIFHMPLNGDHI